MPRKDESADLTRIAIVNKDKCKPKKCKQVRCDVSACRAARVRTEKSVSSRCVFVFARYWVASGSDSCLYLLYVVEEPRLSRGEVLLFCDGPSF